VAEWTKRAELATTRYVGYFPTPQFWAIMNLWKEEQVSKWINILSLKCWRAKMSKKNVLTPLPYVEVTELEEKTITVDHNFIKHGDLDIPLLCKKVTEHGAKDMVVEFLCVNIPKDLLDVKQLNEEAEMMHWKTGDRVAAMFRRTHIKANGAFRAEIKKHTQEWLDMGGKLSSLDLIGLREARYWHKQGDYGAYDVNFMERTVRLVIRALDPQGTLGRWREYKKKKGEVWSLVGDHSIRE